MSITLLHSRVRIATADGQFGVDVPFGDGLNIIRADNSSGKSTLMTAITYCLGLEGMMGPTHALQFALTTQLEYQNRNYPILESEIAIELRNSAGEEITIRRPIKSTSQNLHLVSVQPGRALTGSSGSSAKDYYVRVAGAAVQERGFHFFLERFLGWEIPSVPKYDGSTSPLYLECIFPLFFVEQKHGWGGIQARMPNYLGIREAPKRSIEFVLSLDAYKKEIRKQELQLEAERLKSEWEQTLARYNDVLATYRAHIEGMPLTPVATWPPTLPIKVAVILADKSMTVSDAITSAKARLATIERDLSGGLSNEDRPGKLSEELQIHLRELRNIETLGRALTLELQADEEQLTSVHRRREALAEDLRSYKDILRLRSYGSQEPLKFTTGICPTCEQTVDDSILPKIEKQHPMTLEENTKFIQNELDTFESMEIESRRALQEKKLRYSAIDRELDERRAMVRAVRESLVADSRLPSSGLIAEKISLERRVDELEALQLIVENTMNEFKSKSDRWTIVLSELEKLSGGLLSKQDEIKLSKLERLLVEQLQTYNFTSLPAESLTISRYTYRPNHDGFDLGINLSASDTVRVIWAYLDALMEVARSERTNHLGLLILDEPRQQQTARVSFSEFVKRASQAKAFKQQVIFATSEEEDVLRPLLGDASINYLAFEGKLFTPLGGSLSK